EESDALKPAAKNRPFKTETTTNYQARAELCKDFRNKSKLRKKTVMTTNNEMISLSNIVSSTGVTYSAQANAFLTQAYVSAANNAYFNAIRFAEGIIIKEDVGQGHTHTFLNGLRIYHAASRTLLADRTYHCCFYSEHIVKEE